MLLNDIVMLWRWKSMHSVEDERLLCLGTSQEIIHGYYLCTKLFRLCPRRTSFFLSKRNDLNQLEQVEWFNINLLLVYFGGVSGVWWVHIHKISFHTSNQKKDRNHILIKYLPQNNGQLQVNTPSKLSTTTTSNKNEL
jgi:hypothetical protein